MIGSRTSTLGPISADRLMFLDLEASGLKPGSWPVEIGLAWIDTPAAIHGASCLIRPQPDWSDDLWSSESQAVHGIERRELDDAPSAREVARWVETMVGTRVIVSDAPEYDGRWLDKLMRVIGRDGDIRLVDYHQLAFSTFDRTGISRVFDHLNATGAPHRAGPDAARLAEAWRAAGSHNSPGAEGI